MKRSLTLGITLALALGPASVVSATDYYRDYFIVGDDVFGPGGPFTHSGYWNPSSGGPGGSNDTVNFDIGFAPPNFYTVNNVGGTNNRMLIREDAVTLNLTSNYTLTNPASGTPSLSVAPAPLNNAYVFLVGTMNSILQTQYTEIAAASNSTGSLAVVGSNWQWINDDQIFVGRSGAGELSIQNGGVVSSNLMSVGHSSGSTGELHLGSGSTLDLDGFLVIGQSGHGEMTISAGSVVSNAFAAISSFTGSGGSSAIVTGPDSMWNTVGNLTVGEGDSGTLNVVNGGAVYVDGHCYVGRFSGSQDSFLTVDGTDSSLTTTGQLLLAENGGYGKLTIGPGASVVIEGGIATTFKSEVQMDGGTLTTSTFTGNGFFDWNAGTLHIETFNGNLVNQGGTLAPGQSAGSTTVIGTYNQMGGGGVLDIEIGGTAQGVEHDFISATGNFVVGGQLRLTLINSFVPDASDTFVIASGNPTGIFGMFNNIASGARVDTADGLGSFLVHYGPGSAFPQNQIVLSDFIAADIPGDTNGDLIVDVFDLLDVLGAWGPCDEPCPPSCDADITNSTGTGGDCAVDVFDLIEVLDNWT